MRAQASSPRMHRHPRGIHGSAHCPCFQGVGWLAGIFLLIFIGRSRPIRTRSSPRRTLLVAAWFMYHADRHGVFLDQLALAVSIAGQPVAGPCSRITTPVWHVRLRWWSVFVLSSCLAARTLALFATIAWVYTVRPVASRKSRKDLRGTERRRHCVANGPSRRLVARGCRCWRGRVAHPARAAVDGGGLRRLARPAHRLLLGLSIRPSPPSHSRW